MPSPEAAIVSAKVGDAAAAGTGILGIVGAWLRPIGSSLVWDGLAASSVAGVLLRLSVATALGISAVLRWCPVSLSLSDTALAVAASAVFG